MKIKSALTVIMLLAAGASHSLADVSQGAGRFDYRIEIPAGDNGLATFIPVTKILGVKPGPNLFISTGVHGYEFAQILGVILSLCTCNSALVKN